MSPLTDRTNKSGVLLRFSFGESKAAGPCVESVESIEVTNEDLEMIGSPKAVYAGNGRSNKVADRRCLFHDCRDNTALSSSSDSDNSDDNDDDLPPTVIKQKDGGTNYTIDEHDVRCLFSSPPNMKGRKVCPTKPLPGNYTPLPEQQQKRI